MKPITLDYYRTFAPEVASFLKKWASKQGVKGEKELSPVFWEAAEAFPGAVVFDCRSLRFDFLRDTGEATFEDLEATRGKVKLPFPVCFFELNGWGILAWETETRVFPAMDFGDSDAEFEAALAANADKNYLSCNTINISSILTIPAAETLALDTEEMSLYQLGFVFSAFDGCFGDFENFEPVIEVDEENGTGPTLFIVEHTRQCPTAWEEMLWLSARLVAGITGLLSEKLLVDRDVPDSMPKLNAARKKRGRAPLDGPHHVLTLNIPAIRYAASRSTRLGSHESPCLHWRRGHDRVLYRGSEYERSTRVRRCLVGDPAKGFIRSSYRLVSHLPMPPNAG